MDYGIYVCQSGRTVKIGKGLVERGVRAWVPTHHVLRKSKRRASYYQEVSALPGLLFVDSRDADAAQWLFARRLVPEARPLVINQKHARAQLHELRELDNQVRLAARPVAAPQGGEAVFAVGCPVTIADGPFAGAVGRVVCHFTGGRVAVQTDFVPSLTINACQLAPIHANSEM